jgi:hypothetical protein
VNLALIVPKVKGNNTSASVIRDCASVRGVNSPVTFYFSHYSSMNFLQPDEAAEQHHDVVVLVLVVLPRCQLKNQPRR